jgi:hypothetical protein
VKAADLVRQTLARVSSPPMVSSGLSEADGQVDLRTFDLSMLATAMAALVDATAREHAGGPLLIAADRDDDSDRLTITVGPADAGRDGQTPVAPLKFDRGGVGLSLVLASYVFDAHEAEVESTSSNRTIVRLKKDRGSV